MCDSTIQVFVGINLLITPGSKVTAAWPVIQARRQKRFPVSPESRSLLKLFAEKGLRFTIQSNNTALEAGCALL